MLRNDMGRLLLPPKARALLPNKAYRVIVQKQYFAQGRDATVTPPRNLHRTVGQGCATGVALVND